MTAAKVGLSMLYCLGIPFQKMVDQLDNVETDYVEIVDDGFHELNKRRISTLRNVGASCNLKYSVHAPFADVNIASLSGSMLKAVVKRLRGSIVHSQALDAYVWVFHPGAGTGISAFYPGLGWLQNLKTARTLAKIGNDYGVKIAIENVPEPYPGLMKSVKEFEEFYAKVDEDIGLALDVGHAHINGQIESFLRTFKDKIVHMHVSDNDGKSDQHLGIGRGTINWKGLVNIMKNLHYNGVTVIESVENVEESLQKLKELFA